MKSLVTLGTSCWKPRSCWVASCLCRQGSKEKSPWFDALLLPDIISRWISELQGARHFCYDHFVLISCPHLILWPALRAVLQHEEALGTRVVALVL